MVELPDQLSQNQEGKMNAVSSNPNASVTAFAGALTILVVWGVGVAGLTMPAEVASAFTTIVAAVILWVGRIERSRLREAASAPAPNTSTS
jgi:high-affinity Fe2+/Pb2+ permease